MVSADEVSFVTNEAACRFGIVDGPNVVCVTSFVKAFDELLAHGTVGITGEAVSASCFEESKCFVGGGGEVPTLAVVGDDEVGGAVGAGFFPSSDEVSVEGNDDDLVGGEGASGEYFLERLDHLASSFDFDEDFLFFGDGSDDLSEGRYASIFELFVFPAADIEFLEFGEG